MYIYIYTCMYVCVYIYICIVCVYVYTIYMHTKYICTQPLGGGGGLDRGGRGVTL